MFHVTHAACWHCSLLAEVGDGERETDAIGPWCYVHQILWRVMRLRYDFTMQLTLCVDPTQDCRLTARSCFEFVLFAIL